jgi:hypothetical protein
VIKRILSLATIALVAALLMSPFGWRKYLVFGGIYVPEILAIPLLLIFFPQKNNPISKTLRSKDFLLATAALAFLMMLGFMFHGDFVAAYSDFRCLVAMAFSMILIIRNPMTDQLSKNIAILLFLTLALNAASYVALPALVTTAKFSFPILALLALTYICGSRGWYILMGLGYAVGCYLAVNSFFRQNLAIVALTGIAMIASLFVERKESGAKSHISALTFLGALLAGLSLIPLFVEKLSIYFRSSESRYIQTIGKTREMLAFLSGNGAATSGDSARLAYFKTIGEHFVAFMPPGGLGQKALINQWRSFWMEPSEAIIGSSLDGGHLFIAAHFGLAIGTVLLFWTIARWSKAATSISLRSIPFYLIISAGLILSFFASSPFSQISFAVSFGICLGLLLKGKDIIPSDSQKSRY